MGLRRAVGITAHAAVVLASVAVLATTGVAYGIQQRLGGVTSASVGTVPPVVGEAYTALLVGIDARTDANGEPLPQAVLDALHAGPDEGQLHTDTIMLLHVPVGDGPAVVVSIPRDSFVPIAGDRGRHKINSAYRRGLEDALPALQAQGRTGPALDRAAREAGRAALVATVEQFTGVHVDHLAEVNMAGFVELTEAIGGVPVCLAAPARDPYTGIDLPAGAQTVSGPLALAFVRQRHGLDGGDLDRIARQQAFLAGAAQVLLDAGTLTDPARLTRLADVVARNVVLDSGWDLAAALTDAARYARDGLTFRTVPTLRPDLQTPVDGIAVEVDEAAVREFVAATFAGAGPEAAGAGSTTTPSTPSTPTTPATPTASPAQACVL